MGKINEPKVLPTIISPFHPCPPFPSEGRVKRPESLNNIFFIITHSVNNGRPRWHFRTGSIEFLTYRRDALKGAIIFVRNFLTRKLGVNGTFGGFITRRSYWEGLGGKNFLLCKKFLPPPQKYLQSKTPHKFYFFSPCILWRENCLL